MQTVENAYEILALEIIDFLGDLPWESAGAIVAIIEGMTQSTYWRKFENTSYENEQFPNLAAATSASQAILFLRTEMRRTTGHQIWGLSFTIHPDGKFNLDYNYEKPEGYEESNSIISIDDVTSRLANLGAVVEKISLKK